MQGDKCSCQDLCAQVKKDLGSTDFSRFSSQMFVSTSDFVGRSSNIPRVRYCSCRSNCLSAHSAQRVLEAFRPAVKSPLLAENSFSLMGYRFSNRKSPPTGFAKRLKVFYCCREQLLLSFDCPNPPVFAACHQLTLCTSYFIHFLAVRVLVFSLHYAQ